MAKFKASFQPAFPIWEYNPDGLSNYSEKALRSEYSRMRAAAEKRLRSFERAGMTDREAYLYNVDRYKPLKAISGTSELKYLLGDLARFMTAKLGTVSGQRENDQRLVNTFRDKWGVKNLTTKNLQSFLDFLDFAKGQKGFKYDVAAVGDMWDAQQKAKIDPATIEGNFEFYKANYADFGDFWKFAKGSGLKWSDKQIVKFYKDAKKAGITGGALRDRIGKAIESGGESFAPSSMLKVIKVLS